jgi:hypothetical protein
MKRGGKFLVSTIALAVAACGGEQANLKVRSIPTPLAQGAKPVPFRVAEARGQLALGNVALALEAFRKALREDPNSTDALAGIANCYDLMGRYDLSRRNYEAALALAPANVELLGAFAQSLQLQGEIVEAARVRDEIATRLAQRAPEPGRVPQVAPTPPQVAERVPESVPAPQVASMISEAHRVVTTVPRALTAPAPVTVVQAAPPAEVVIPRPALPAAPLNLAETAGPAKAEIALPSIPAASVVEEAPPPEPAVAPQRVEQAAIGSSVTIKLPPVRKIEASTRPLAATAVAAPKPAAAPVELPPLAPYDRPVPKPTVVQEQGPRLERLSLGEIALVTAPGPVWRTTVLARTDISTKLRFVPIRQASTLPVKVRLLNAARVDRLAARTRTWLSARGWRGLAIGDARTTRTRSMIYYPASQRALAQRLSAQFGFALVPQRSGAQITVLLGTDAARHPALKPRRA